MKKLLPPRNQTERGSVLIVVMVLCIGLVSLTLLFGHSMAMAYHGSENDLEGRQADRAIEGASRYVQYLMTVSASDAASGNTTGTGTSAPTTTTGTDAASSTATGNFFPDPTTYQSEGVQVGESTFWFIGIPATQDTTASTPTFGLVDEAGKLNLNTASATMLEKLPYMTTTLAQEIVAWRRRPQTSGTGTATTTSASGNSTAANKGGPFESIYELAQIVDLNGEDPSILYGTDSNQNHVLDAGESDGGQHIPGLYDYVTVFSREPNKLADGTARINVTTATGAQAGAIRNLLSTVLGQTRAQQIMAATNAATGGRAPRSVLELYIRGKMTADELDKITPKLCMRNGAYSTGLINVNTASAEVLACVPGITSDNAAAIVSARVGQTQPHTNLAFVADILGEDASVQAGRYLTTYSYQVSADVAAVGRNGRGYRRTQLVIDASNGTPQIVYRRNLAAVGWALGPDALQNAIDQKTNGTSGQNSGQNTGQKKATQ